MPKPTNSSKKSTAPKPAAKSKVTKPKAVEPAVDAPVEVPAVLETAPRNTVIPKASPAGAAVSVTKAPVPVTYERIAERAYYISQNGGGSEFENWIRAEAELKNESL
ncbi:MAG: DUF2934 domain-containing protein [Tepidisphaeraceae bacterium]